MWMEEGKSGGRMEEGKRWRRMEDLGGIGSYVLSHLSGKKFVPSSFFIWANGKQEQHNEINGSMNHLASHH